MMRILLTLTFTSFVLTLPSIAAAAEPVRASKYMAATANPLASEAALDILRKGGSAVDAAIAAQMVLTLVEPQSSGIGGGGFMMHFDATSGDVVAYDGRETAPASARPDMFLKDDGGYMGWHEAVVGGVSVGVPGLVRMLELAHRDHGKLPWADLFEAGIRIAKEGFPVSNRMNYLSEADEQLRVFPTTAAYFLRDDGTAHPEGTIIRNPALAETLTVIAEKGADGFYTGDIAQAISDTVSQAPRNPTPMTLDDIAGYQAKKRDAVCLDYRVNRVCGMPPPSSGGITTLQILGILEGADLSAGPDDLATRHLIAEASRLAFADRNQYLADPDVAPPPPGLLDKAYLASRGTLIDPTRSMGTAEPGSPDSEASIRFAPSGDEHGVSTTHLSIVDGSGNAVSMTTSIETQFGSRLFVRGFLLNNQLTDFAWKPEKDGKPVANAVAPNKRPRSSMSPTLVFDANGDFKLAVGSPGGSSIIGYVAKTLIAWTDWDMNIQAAIDVPHLLNRNGKTRVEEGTSLEPLVPGLEALGHEVDLRRMTSGLQGIAKVNDGYEGGADPRREGSAVGD